MNKSKAIWEWFLKLDSLQITKFWAAVWLPISLILIFPLFTMDSFMSHDGTYLGKVLMLSKWVMCGYMFYIPISLDQLRKAVIKRRLQKQQ